MACHFAISASRSWRTSLSWYLLVTHLHWWVESDCLSVKTNRSTYSCLIQDFNNAGGQFIFINILCTFYSFFGPSCFSDFLSLFFSILLGVHYPEYLACIIHNVYCAKWKSVASLNLLNAMQNIVTATAMLTDVWWHSGTFSWLMCGDTVGDASPFSSLFLYSVFPCRKLAKQGAALLCYHTRSTSCA